MKKIFAIYGRVTITEQPGWLPAFLVRFQKTPHWEPHVTLKQSCFVTESDIPIINKLIENFLRAQHRLVIPAVFDKVLANPESPFILLGMEHSKELMDLQAELVHILKDYREYAEPELEGYEKDFNPHLTIADDLDREQNKAARRKLSEGCIVKGMIEEIVLIVAQDPQYPASDRKLSHTIYRL